METYRRTPEWPTLSHGDANTACTATQAAISRIENAVTAYHFLRRNGVISTAGTAGLRFEDTLALHAFRTIELRLYALFAD